MTSKKLFRNNFIFALVILIAVSLAFPVKGYAAAIPTPDVARIGSISVTMRDSKSKEVVPGGEFTMYKVAEAKSVGLDWSFEYTDDFAGCSSDLGADLDEKLADDIATYIKAKSIGGKAASIGDTGKVTFDKLSIGLYLLVQTEAANGYTAVKPFLVSIPLKSGAELIYDVDATPKMGDISMPTVDPTPTVLPSPSVQPSPSVEPSPGTKPSPSVEPSPSAQPTPSAVPNPSSQPDPTNATKPNDSSVSKSEPSVTKVPAPTVATVAKLPQTGQMNWPIPVMLAAGLACLCIGWYLCNSDTEKEDRDAS